MSKELSEEELIGLQMSGMNERMEDKYGDYFRWANQADPGTTMNDDLFPGMRSKEITLANLNSTEVRELNVLTDMAEWEKRMLNPGWNPSPGDGMEEFASLNQAIAMKARISRGRQGFERRQQTKQVHERRVSTDTRGGGKVGSLLSKLFPGGQ